MSTAIGITAVSVAAHDMENDVTCLWMELEQLLVKQIATFSVIASGRSQSGFPWEKLSKLWIPRRADETALWHVVLEAQA